MFRVLPTTSMPQVFIRATISTSSPTHPHKGLHKRAFVTLSSPTSVYYLEALGGCCFDIVEYVFVTLGLCKSYYDY